MKKLLSAIVLCSVASIAYAASWGPSVLVSFTTMIPEHVNDFIVNSGATNTTPAIGSCTTANQIYKYHVVTYVKRPPSNTIQAQVRIYLQTCN